MFKKIYLVAGVLSLAFSSVYAGKLSPEKVDALIQKREEIRNWAPTCADGSYSEKMHECHQHDVTLFAGISCLAATLSGDTQTRDDRCSDVENAQGENGRFWRGPIRVGDENNPFSRDMTRGALAYILAGAYLDQNSQTRLDTRLNALAWIKWIGNNDEGFKVCKNAKGNRCAMTPGTTNLFYEIYSVLKLLDPNYGINPKLINKIKRKKNYESFLFGIETGIFTQDGYPRHLKATSLLIYRILNMELGSPGKTKDKSKRKRWNRIAKKLFKKDSNNLLMRFHHEGANDKLADMLIQTCPSIAPRTHLNLRDFRWQRHGGDLTNGGRPSDGHDCIYLINLMLAHHNGSLYW